MTHTHAPHPLPPHQLELEELLRRTCEALIQRSTVLCVGRVSKWLEAHGAATAPAPPAADPAAYAAAVVALCEATLGELVAVLPPLRRRLGLVLGSPMTAAILFKPVRERALVTLFALRQHAHESLAAVPAPPPAEGGGAAAPAPSPARAAIEAALLACVQAVEASDVIVTDPTSSAFGYDTAVFTSRLHAAAATTSATPSPAAAATATT